MIEDRGKQQRANTNIFDAVSLDIPRNKRI